MRPTRKGRTLKARTLKKRTVPRKQRGGSNVFRIMYNGVEVNGQELDKVISSSAPEITIPENHYVIMYDPDAIYPEYIHWIVTNSSTPLPYIGPSPPPRTGMHHYVFLLIKGLVPTTPIKRNRQDVQTLINGPILAKKYFMVRS